MSWQQPGVTVEAGSCASGPTLGASTATSYVVLAAAYLDHDPTNNRTSNLKALCQRCHMLNDWEEHVRRRWLTYRMRKALGDLFLGLYRAR